MLRQIVSEIYYYWVDEQGHRQGAFTERYNNGKPFLKCNYLDGVQHGIATWYHSNGNMWKKAVYVNGIRRGEYMYYSDNGHLLDHCFYIDDKRIPFSEIPYPETPEELLYFTLKYDLQLLPLEQTC